MATDPIDETKVSTAPRLAIAPAYTDPVTGASYVHEDLRPIALPWEVEQHIPPIKRTETFGDVESWVAYVKQFSEPDAEIQADGVLLTWSEKGFLAVLDYPKSDRTPDRCQWLARQPFEHSAQWRAWTQLANGAARSQRQVLEALEDLAPDIVEPDAATIAGILRKLRATASASADTELLADGSSRITWKKSTSVTAGEIALPAEIQIAIPVLKGHTVEVDGKQSPVLYRLAVRLRVSVDDDARLSLRLSMPGAERVLEAVFADRVAAAKRLLGDGYSLLRGTAV